MNIKKEVKILSEDLELMTNVIVDRVSLEWVLQNTIDLTQKFSKMFKKSPYEFVVKIPTAKGFVLFSNDRNFRNINSGRHLKWTVIKKMGCPHSVKNRYVK